MLGRRKSRSSPEAIDITERIRRRKLSGSSSGKGMPANSGNLFSKPKRARNSPSGRGAKTAKLLSFEDTPVYRVQAAACVPHKTLYLALAVLADRLETQGPMAGPRQEMWQRIGDLIGDVLEDLEIRLALPEQSELIERLLDELTGFGPLGALLADDSVSEIMVNGPNAVYVLRRGRVQATDVVFRGPAHLAVVLERIAAAAGRRLDERQPLVDLRITDRVRANILVPPLAMGGPQVTLRKNLRRPVSLERMVRQQDLSADMAAILDAAVRARLNILIVGGSGSGKTTLLDAISESIDRGERIVTIEDTVELGLLQPRVLRLETRPLGGSGADAGRQVIRNALRMCPDRVIFGQLRGSEAADVITAASSGLDGVLGTLRASCTRDALDRLARLVSRAEPGVPIRCYRSQVAEAVNLVVQVERCSDGLRRVTRITEVIGMNGDAIVTRKLIAFEQSGVDENGRVLGSFKTSGWVPRFLDWVRNRGLERGPRIAPRSGLRPAAGEGER